ncbi:hypothetical protein J7L29_04620 [Candidatus Bathyarchaeota archaeon]|nr:hypothetical protein [Candidatus Bathyarchaeota archaeon]
MRVSYGTQRAEVKKLVQRALHYSEVREMKKSACFKLDDLKEKYCLNCENYLWCWHYGEGYCYHEDIIYKNYKIKDMRRVIAKLGALNKKHEAFYYGAPIEEYEELRKILGVKEKTPKYTDAILLNTEITAIVGLNETVGFYYKHKLHYHQEPFAAQMNQDILYACPLCMRAS